MRTFPCGRPRPLIRFACAIGIAMLGPTPGFGDSARSTVPLPERSPAREVAHPSNTRPSNREFQISLDRGDRIAALHALQMALNQVGDGGTFLWKKNNRDLRGVIKPTSAFRNAHGQVCRHVIYALSLRGHRKQIEIVACREAGGRWRL